jgi:hypothetical protein
MSFAEFAVALRERNGIPVFPHDCRLREMYDVLTGDVHRLGKDDVIVFPISVGTSRVLQTLEAHRKLAEKRNDRHLRFAIFQIPNFAKGAAHPNLESRCDLIETLFKEQCDLFQLALVTERAWPSLPGLFSKKHPLPLRLVISTTAAPSSNKSKKPRVKPPTSKKPSSTPAHLESVSVPKRKSADKGAAASRPRTAASVPRSKTAPTASKSRRVPTKPRTPHAARTRKRAQDSDSEDAPLPENAPDFTPPTPPKKKASKEIPDHMPAPSLSPEPPSSPEETQVVNAGASQSPPHGDKESQEQVPVDEVTEDESVEEVEEVVEVAAVAYPAPHPFTNAQRDAASP